MRFKVKNERVIDMIIKLYAINIVSNGYPYSKVTKTLKDKDKVKAQIALMVEDDELLAELTKESAERSA